MGQVAGATAVKLGTLTLNDLFNKTNIGATKTRVDDLRNIYPGLLRRKKNAPADNPARQRTLRFAAWLLTADITYIKDDVSGKNFSTWLKWLTWLKKEHPRAHNDIRNAIEDNLALGTPWPMMFIWTKATTEEDFSYDIKKVPKASPDHYEISVVAKDGPSITPTDEDDQDKPVIDC